MKAIRKSDGKVIEFTPVIFGYISDNAHYHPSELDFNVEEAEQRISVAKLREVLMDMAYGTGFLAEDVDEIINRVKESI